MEKKKIMALALSTTLATGIIPTVAYADTKDHEEAIIKEDNSSSSNANEATEMVVSEDYKELIPNISEYFKQGDILQLNNEKKGIVSYQWVVDGVKTNNNTDTLDTSEYGQARKIYCVYTLLNGKEKKTNLSVNNNLSLINNANINATTSAAIEVKPIVTVDFNDECDSVNEALNNFKVSNDTTEQEVLNNVKNSVDSTINIEFGTNKGQAFNIIKATTTATGSITGTLIVKDALSDSKEILVKLTIAQLEVSLDRKIESEMFSINPLSLDEGTIITGDTTVVNLGNSIGEVEIPITDPQDTRGVSINNAYPAKPYLHFSKVCSSGGHYYIAMSQISAVAYSHGNGGPNGIDDSTFYYTHGGIITIVSDSGNRYILTSSTNAIPIETGINNGSWYEIPKQLLVEGIKSIEIKDANGSWKTTHDLYDRNGFLYSRNDKSGELKGTFSGRKTLSRPVYVNLKQMEIEDFFGNVKANVSDIPNQNNLTQSKILEYLNNGIDSSKVSVAISNYKYTPSTDIVSGSYTGVVTVTMNGESKTFNLNVVIPQLAQSIESVYNNFNAYLPKMLVTNDTTKDDFINGVVVTNPEISVTMPVFNLSKSTDINEGRIVCLINITDKSSRENKTISIDKPISKIAQSADTAKSNIIKVLKYLDVNNNTNEDDILTSVRSCIDSSSVNVTFKNDDGKFSIKEAKETEKGIISGILEITDVYGGRQEVPVNVEIDYLKQSVLTVANMYRNQLNKFVATNETKNEDILTSVYIQNPDIKVELKDFDLIKATDEAKGKITGTVEISLGSEVEQVEINLDINYLPLELSTAVKITQQEINKSAPVNNFDFYELQSRIDKLIRNSDIHVTYSLEKTPEIDKATEYATGKITGTIILRQDDFNVEVPLELIITQLPQTVEGAKKDIENMIPNIPVTNDTEKDNVLDELKKVITGADGSTITITIKDWNKDKATEDKDGSITATVIIEDNFNNKEEVEFNFKIDQLAQTIGGIITKLNVFLKEKVADNSITYESLLEEANELITNVNGSNISISLKNKNEDIKATQFEAGNISGTFSVTDGVNTTDLDFNFIRNKLDQTPETLEVYLKAELENMKANNKTEAADILEKISVNGIDENITISFGTEENEKFNKVLATEEAAGGITGVINVSDGSNIIKIPVNLEIDKLIQTVNEAKTYIEATLNNMTANNSTTEQNIIDNVKANIRENITISFGTEENEKFNKVLATEDEAGVITGVINVSDGTDTVKVPVDLSIAKLIKPSTGTSGGSSGGSGGSSSSSSHSKSKSETVEFEGQFNSSTLGANFSWHYENGNWKHKTNGIFDIGWVQINGFWYFFDTNGYMVTGWLNYNNTWYYLSGEAGETLGMMQTGWLDNYNTWYYLDSSGAMQTGWIKIDNNWHYCDNSGAMQTGWQQLDGKWYYLKSSGAMLTGWQQLDSEWYYLDSSGAMQTGWINSDNTWYYSDSSGTMLKGWIEINGCWYYFNDSGAMQSDCRVDGYEISSTGALIA